MVTWSTQKAALVIQAEKQFLTHCDNHPQILSVVTLGIGYVTIHIADRLSVKPTAMKT